MRKATRRGVAIGIAAALLLSAGPTRAQPVADFYRGKTLRMLIGYGPGGGSTTVLFPTALNTQSLKHI
jgi:hypothetical protein